MSKLISVCSICKKAVFVIDTDRKEIMKKPFDDPRIRHLNYDHKIRRTTLGDDFKTIHQADSIDLFVMVSKSFEG